MTGQTPLETEPAGKAAHEIRQLYRYVKKLEKEITREGVNILTSEDVNKLTSMNVKKGRKAANG